MSQTYHVFRMPHVRYFSTFMIVCSLLYHIPSRAQAEQDATTSATTDATPSTSKESPQSPTSTIAKKTKVILSYYFDSRDYNTMNVLVNSTALPWGFNVFGF